MSDLLNIGASGVRTYRSALGVVGENVVNADTQGYARRDIRTSPTAVAGAADPYHRAGVRAGGVVATGVARAGDPFLTADSRLTSADAARAQARLRWLEQAGGSLPDNDAGIGAKLTAVFSAGTALAASPDGALPRQQFLHAIDEAASAMRAAAGGLSDVANGIATEAGGVVDQVNATLQSLDKVNMALRRSVPGSSNQAQLLDERDRALDQLAGAIGITATFDAKGAVTVDVAGSNTRILGQNGPSYIDVAVSSDGRLSLSALRAGEESVLQPTGGSLAGLVEGAAAVSGRRRQLDTAAVGFAAQINQWQANGTVADGSAGQPLLSMTGGAATLTLATTDAAAIAAAKDGIANGNAVALSELRGADGVETRIATLVTGHAQMVAASRAEASAAATRRDAAATARDEVSGVDLDREAAELIRFQQAYDGSARVIQVARETLQSILSLF